MLIHDSNSVLFNNSDAANSDAFFNGSHNTLTLDFDPLITGYSFFKWIKVPTWVQNTFTNFKNMTEKNFLEGFSISDIELETGNMTWGFAGNEYNFATNAKKGNTEFSIKHREYSGSPIRNMYQYWITGIRDPETGIATYPRLHKMAYGAKNHTGSIIYIVTRPDVTNVDTQNIEYACFYSAVFPTKIQLSQFNYTHGSHDAVEYDQTFKGVFHMSPAVDKLASNVLKEHTYGLLEMSEFKIPDKYGDLAYDGLNGAANLSSHTPNDGLNSFSNTPDSNHQNDPS